MSALILLDTGRKYLVSGRATDIIEVLRQNWFSEFNLESGSGSVWIPSSRVVAIEDEWRRQARTTLSSAEAEEADREKVASA